MVRLREGTVMTETYVIAIETTRGFKKLHKAKKQVLPWSIQ